jgi:divalent metal cation (Fe/Co/Zn/Cd) transporter
LSVIVLAAYVVYDAINALYHGESPERSIAGLTIAIISLFVMPTLFLVKRRTAMALRSRSLFADAKQTLACMLLSAALLLGSGLHYTIGWWQADPFAALAIAAYLVRESYTAWTEQDLCC